MKFLPVLLPFFALVYSCQNPPAKELPVSEKDTVKKNYLPVADLLRSEIASVDSFPMLIRKYEITGNRKDSTVLTVAEFDRIAREFIQPGLDSAYFDSHFSESSFLDQSTDMSSFTYSTKDTGFGLKRVDVLLKHTSTGEKLNSIYMETFSGNQDSSFIRKMSWKAGRNFSILQITQPKGRPESASQTLVVWDTRE
jgi:hypothetical protein